MLSEIRLKSGFVKRRRAVAVRRRVQDLAALSDSVEWPPGG